MQWKVGRPEMEHGVFKVLKYKAADNSETSFFKEPYNWHCKKEFGSRCAISHKSHIAEAGPFNKFAIYPNFTL